MAAGYEIYKDRAGNYRFWLIAGNGRLLLKSKAYGTKRACRKAIEAARKSASAIGRFERRKAKDGQDFFVLKAGNHRLLGRSEHFRSSESMDDAIEIVRKSGPRSPVNDLSPSWRWGVSSTSSKSGPVSADVPQVNL